MEKLNRELGELENRVSTLHIPDITMLTNEQVQVVAARIMNLSGKLNHLAYQLLFSLNLVQNSGHSEIEENTYGLR